MEIGVTGFELQLFLLSETLERDLSYFPLRMVTTRQRENDRKLAIVRVKLRLKNIKIKIFPFSWKFGRILWLIEDLQNETVHDDFGIVNDIGINDNLEICDLG